MTDLPQSLAPGCFGISLVYREDAKECLTCPFMTKCGPIAVERLAHIRADLGIVDRGPPVKKQELKTSAGPIANAGLALPRKVEELIARIERAGIKVTEALGRGENPFTKSPAFMRIACHLLLRIPNGFSRDTLRQAFMTKLEWSEGTAAAHALQVFQALTALGAADESNGIIKLRK